MKFKNTVLLFFLFLGLLVINHSCSIEKRRVLPGYHISWKSRPDKVQRNARPPDRYAKDTQRSQSSTDVVESDGRQIDFAQASSEKNSNPELSVLENAEADPEKLSKEELQHSAEGLTDPPIERKVHEHVLWGILTGIGAILVAILFFSLAESCAFGAVILLVPLFLIWLGLSGLSLFFGVNSFIDTMNHPEKYKGLFWVFLALAVGAASIYITLYLGGFVG